MNQKQAEIEMTYRLMMILLDAMEKGPYHHQVDLALCSEHG